MVWGTCRIFAQGLLLKKCPPEPLYREGFFIGKKLLYLFHEFNQIGVGIDIGFNWANLLIFSVTGGNKI
jgi:hypothetical protein